MSIRAEICGSDDRESACNAEDLGLILGSGRSSGEGNGNPLQDSCPENPHGQRSLTGYSLWGCKELHTAQCLINSCHLQVLGVEAAAFK